MTYYSNQMFEKLKKERLSTKIFLILFSCILVLICGFLAFSINEKNQLLITIINIILTTILLWIIIFVVENEIFVRSRKIKHFEIIFKSSTKEYIGQIIKVGNVITLNGGILGRELLISVYDKKLCLYILSDFNCCFNENDNVKLKTCKEFITYMEVIK